MADTSPRIARNGRLLVYAEEPRQVTASLEEGGKLSFPSRMKGSSTMDAAKHEFPQSSLDFLFGVARHSQCERVRGARSARCRSTPVASIWSQRPMSTAMWALCGPDDGPLVGLEGHIDQIGLTVKHVNDNGYLHVDFVGGSWEVYARRVTVHTQSGPVPGVIESSRFTTPRATAATRQSGCMMLDRHRGA